jgi:hypothetical protein
MKDYPTLYNQNNYGATDLGNSTVDTIQSGGCFDCCYAMKACYYGHQIDPTGLNKLFIDKGVYTNATGHPDKDLLTDYALTQIYPDVKYLKTLDYEPIATDLGTLQNLLADPATTVTLRINFGSGNYHFVEAVACDGVVVHIANPISGKIEDFSQRYGNPVTAKLHFIVYTGPVRPATISQTDTGAASPSPLALRFTQAITKSGNFDVVAQHFGLSNDQATQIGAGQQIVEKIAFLEKEVEDQQATIGELQRKLTTPAASIPVVAPVAPIQAADTIPSSPTFASGKSAVSGGLQPVAPEVPAATDTLVNQALSLSVGSYLLRLFKILFV